MITVRDGQSLFDVAVEQYGRAEAGFDLAIRNGLDIVKNAIVKDMQLQTVSVTAVRGVVDVVTNVACELRERVVEGGDFNYADFSRLDFK